MNINEAIEWINIRMCMGRGKWSEHNPPRKDEPWQAGLMAIEALRNSQWIPCSERLPEEDEVVLVTMRIYTYRSKWEEQLCIEFGRIGSKRYDIDGTGWEWLNESGADYWQADYNDSIIAWMPLPKPYNGGE